jgi:N-acetylneuraminate lyase
VRTPLLAGLVAAPFTPFLATGEVNYELVPRLCEHLVSQRVAAAFVCGTTGEGTSLSDEERRKVTDAWIHAAQGRFRIVVHVGHLATVSARELAEHAAATGADAIATCAPSFVPIQSVDSLLAVTAETAAGAPGLPFYFYHIPAFTRLELSMADYLEQAAARIPNFRGIKFTHSDFEEFVRLTRFRDGAYEILSGREQMLLAALASGTRGAIGSNFNFAAPLYLKLWAAFERGDLAEARALQARAIELTLVFRRFGGMRAMKATMALLGLDCGAPRAPLRPLNAAEMTGLRAALVRLEGVGLAVAAAG